MLHSLARIASHLNTLAGNPSEFERYVDRQGSNPFDIEHILPDDYETYKDQFNDEEDFNNYRARFGNLILLSKDKNRSYQGMKYIDKVERYRGDNILAQSLNSQSYLNNPGFRPLAAKYKFRPHDSIFGKDEIKERESVYRAIAQDVWNMESIKAIVGGWTEEEEVNVIKPGERVTNEPGGNGFIDSNMSAWIIPCNINDYDVAGAFSKLEFIEWTQSTSMKTGDVVYIYLSWPIHQIKYKCVIIEHGLSLEQRQADDLPFYKSDKLLERMKSSKFIRLKLLHVFNDGVLTFAQMKKAGNKSNFQSAMRVTDVIWNEIRRIQEV